MASAQPFVLHMFDDFLTCLRSYYPETPKADALGWGIFQGMVRSWLAGPARQELLFLCRGDQTGKTPHERAREVWTLTGMDSCVLKLDETVLNSIPGEKIHKILRYLAFFMDAVSEQASAKASGPPAAASTPCGNADS